MHSSCVSTVHDHVALHCDVVVRRRSVRNSSSSSSSLPRPKFTASRPRLRGSSAAGPPRTLQVTCPTHVPTQRSHARHALCACALCAGHCTHACRRMLTCTYRCTCRCARYARNGTQQGAAPYACRSRRHLRRKAQPKGAQTTRLPLSGETCCQCDDTCRTFLRCFCRSGCRCTLV